jgi:phage terminase small subunit
MPFLQNTRHERLAQLVASGKHSDMEAFKQAGYANESAHQNACRLRANESVAARIEELRARNAEKCRLSRDEAVQYLVEILKRLSEK